MLNDETLVDKEGMVDANVNDAIDGDCFVCCPLPSKMIVLPKQNNNNNNNESEKELGKQKRTCGFCKKSPV